MIVDTSLSILLTSLYLCLAAIFLLITYACLLSLWYSLSSCIERVRDYLGQVNKG